MKKNDLLETERQLNPRLKIIAILLFACSLCALAWDFIPSAEDEIDVLLLEIEDMPPPISPYLASSSFAVVGICSLLIYWRKKKSLSKEIPPES